jgi:predicted RNA-binding protein with PIN domain
VKGYNQGALTSYPIKEQVTENLVIFQFYSSKELQSLKDALNLETARQELLNKTKSSEEIDSLFK